MVNEKAKEFIYAHLFTIENKIKLTERVKETYKDLLNITTIPSTEDIAYFIDAENEYILDSVEDMDYIYDFYDNNHRYKMDYYVETILNELGYHHSIKGNNSGSSIHPLQIKLIEEVDLYKESLYVGYRYF